MLRNIAKKIYHSLPDTFYHQITYYRIFKKLPNLSRPLLFSEKILVRNMKPKKIYTKLADKLQVREYIEGVIGEKYLINLYGTSEELTYAVYKNLPNAFVVKANHGSGFNEVVFDKTKTNYEDLYELTSSWLNCNFYKMTKEKHYDAIKPCLIFEELLLVGDSVPNDLKFHCFNKDGVIKVFIQVDYSRFGVHRRDIFDCDWNRTEIRLGLRNNPEPMLKPKMLEEMVSLATRIANQFSYVRVDFYEVGDKIYFGELTFTPGGGLCQMRPPTVQREWGSYFED